ncbi:MAG: bifunctional 4-hydroxy-2-oxoglutarate aldolase/2-dehydro-3-deoxy-phosphogluconate aldolase [Bacteroidota bacterium]
MTDFLEKLKKNRLVAVIRGEDPEQALFAARLAFDCGLSLVEVTFTTPDALSVIARLRAEGHPVGAGTVLSREDGEAAIQAGASFLVSPHADPEIIRLPLPVIPGVATPTEVMLAHKAGARVMKLFPAASYGPRHLRMLLDPFPFLQVMCTGGVDEGNALEYLDAGAVAVGHSSALFPRNALRDRDEASIRPRLLRLLRLCQGLTVL